MKDASNDRTSEKRMTNSEIGTTFVMVTMAAHTKHSYSVAIITVRSFISLLLIKAFLKVFVGPSVDFLLKTPFYTLLQCC